METGGIDNLATKHAHTLHVLAGLFSECVHHHHYTKIIVVCLSVRNGSSLEMI